jgi:demethylmenaquinone methyltransferase/2-methoxy-6-polyprenyl-1,4-benzoquinol methylase
LNHLLSFNVDRYWRSRTVSRLQSDLSNPQCRVLDLCCGTGDLTLALKHAARGSVYGSDFCHPMLTAARKKVAGLEFFEADTLQMPLPESAFDVITIAFGFRNLANYEKGLTELFRLLRRGGKLAILEFSQPPNKAFAALYDWYSNHLLPKIGSVISGAPDAYTYLPESVRRFPAAEELAGMMRRTGFSDVSFERMTLGIVALHVGSRS